MKTIIPLIIPVLFMGLGGYLLYKFFEQRITRRNAMNWPTTKALILETTMVEEPVRNAIGNINVAYLVSVKYEYNLNGVTMQGDRITFGKPAFSYMVASNVVDQFAEGKQVPLYYNPKNPKDVILAPKTEFGMNSWLPGFFFLVVGLVVGFITYFM